MISIHLYCGLKILRLSHPQTVINWQKRFFSFKLLAFVGLQFVFFWVHWAACIFFVICELDVNSPCGIFNFTGDRDNAFV
eukprot:scaffold273420_cov37-Prasinocladus_malaysianus.AAC.1